MKGSVGFSLNLKKLILFSVLIGFSNKSQRPLTSIPSMLWVKSCSNSSGFSALRVSYLLK